MALVTGASSGIGRHMAMVLASAGADVVLVARRAEKLTDAVQAIADNGGRAAAVSADLNDRTQLDGVIEEATASYGAPTILVNAAGVNFREPWDQITDDSWDTTINLNLSVPFFLGRKCVPGMMEKGYGRIINIASLQSYRAFADSMPYGASKGA